MNTFTEIPLYEALRERHVIRAWYPTDGRNFIVGLTDDGFTLLFPNTELTPEDHAAIRDLVKESTP